MPRWTNNKKKSQYQYIPFFSILFIVACLGEMIIMAVSFSHSFGQLWFLLDKVSSDEIFGENEIFLLFLLVNQSADFWTILLFIYLSIYLYV